MRFLYLLAFTAGFVVLGVEISASRLLEPAFGNSQLVWAAIIGLILLYLAVGAWLGGRLADRFPTRRALDITLSIAALGVALIPLVSRPVLHMAARGMDSFALGLLGGALLAIVLLFSLPILLLGTASPWAGRLLLAEGAAQGIQGAQIGTTLGRLSAIGTIGSLLGSFLPVLLLIPAVGTRWTFFILALTLLLVLALGALRQRYVWIPLLGLLIVAVLAWWSAQNPSIRAGWEDVSYGTILYEDESMFNYIAVREWGDERHLKLNDGVGIHSVYHPNTTLSAGIWDYFLLAPLFRSAPAEGTLPAPENLLLIGMAAGTVSGLYSDIYGAIPITGVELDPQILEVGSQFFAMDRPNLTTAAADGRRWLAQQPADAQWDVIAVDAYRPPYIPFHLTTQEFFQLAYDHLDADGVLAMNIGRTATNNTLVDALAATVGTIFPSVFLLDEPGPADALGNTLLVATKQPESPAAFMANVARIAAQLGDEVAQMATVAASVAHAAAPSEMAPFTDDHAPVEWIVHGIVLDYLAATQ